MASAKTWFVKTGFGTVLGPMPTDVLREMVRTGEMVRSDQVREGTNGQWYLASEIPGLFDAIAASDSESQFAEPPIAVEPLIAPIDMPPAESEPSRTEHPVSDSVPHQTDSPATEPVGSAPIVTPELTPPSSPSSVKGRLIPPPKPFERAMTSSPPISAESPAPIAVAVEGTVELPKIRPFVKRPAEPPTDDVAEIRSAPPEDDLISRWRESRDRSREELGTVSLAAEMTQSKDDEDRAPELPADLLSDDEFEASAPAPVSSISETTTRRLTIDKPRFLDQVAGLEEGPRVREESSSETWNRWRRSLPDLRIAVVLLVVVFAAWWFWPRSSHGIQVRYVAIWDEWKGRREDLKDQAGWEQFLKRTETELKATIPYLEKHASPKDREKQLLLFIGRDCLQKMLDQPRQVGSLREKQLQLLLTALNEINEPSAAGPPSSSSAAMNASPKDADPEQAPGGRIDPTLLLRQKDQRRPLILPRPGVLTDEKPFER